MRARSSVGQSIGLLMERVFSPNPTCCSLQEKSEGQGFEPPRACQMNGDTTINLKKEEQKEQFHNARIALQNEMGMNLTDAEIVELLSRAYTGNMKRMEKEKEDIVRNTDWESSPFR